MFDEKENSLTMRMEQKWAAEDLRILLEATGGLYNLFFVMGTLEKDLHEYERFIERFIHFPPFKEYKKFLRRFPFGYPSELSYLSIIRYSVHDLLEKMDIFVAPDQKLMISKIQFESPGMISLEGSGEIIRELRELVKDIWYRNKGEKRKRQQEEEFCKLEILEKKISILEKLGYSRLEIREMMGFAERKIEIIDSLMKEKKLHGLYESENPKN